MATARIEVERELKRLSRTLPCVDPNLIVEVVESVMASLEGDRAGLSHRLHADIEALADFITAAKAEIAAVKADKINREYLPAATDELEAIVGATEQATNAIFAAIESIDALTADMSPEIAQNVTEQITRVYEACGFQDITGQRISKVVATLQQVEVKVQALLYALGEEAVADGGPAQDRPAAPRDHAGKDTLMNGPQLPGTAISQDDVDALLASFD